MANVVLSGSRVEFSVLDHITAFVERFNAWRSYRRTFAELSRLTDRELADVGLTRSDISAIARKEISSLVG